MYRLTGKDHNGRWIVLGEHPSRVELSRMAATTYAHMQTKIRWIG